MPKRMPIEIKKKILLIIKKDNEVSLSTLERKVNASNLTIKRHVEELEFFGKVVVVRHKKSKHNGRPCTTIKLK